MDTSKVKVILSATAGTLALFILYKLLSRGKGSIAVGGANFFAGQIDPRLSIDIREKKAKEFVQEFVK